MKRYYLKRDRQKEQIIYDVDRQPCFKLWCDLTVKLGEMGAILMTLQDEELYTIAETKMTCLVYKEDALVAECFGGPSQPHLQLFRRIYRVELGEKTYQLKGNWLGFDFTNERSWIDVGRLEEVTIMLEEERVGAIRLTELDEYQVELHDQEDGPFWMVVLAWIDHSPSRE